MLQDSFSEHPDLPTSLIYASFSSLATYSAEDPIQTVFALLWDHFSSGSHLPFRTSSPLHPLSAAPLFYRHPSVQNTILPNKVLWSALFLLPGSSYLKPAPCFCLPFYLCQLFEIFLENLSLLKKLFFSSTALISGIRLCVFACVWCVCMCVLYVLNFKYICI